MIELDFDKRVRSAARAAVAGVSVPPCPRSLRQQRAGMSRRRALGWCCATAAGIAIALTGATDGGRAAIAYAVEHTVKVFSIDPDTGKRTAVSTISLQEALSTAAFRVVEPHGLPAGARLVSIRRIGDPETGRPSVLFAYEVGGQPFEILESGSTQSDSTASQAVRQSSSALPERRDAQVRIVAPRMMLMFRAGQTRIVLATQAGALTAAQMEAIRRAMAAP